jgi:hypothetical protein
MDMDGWVFDLNEIGNQGFGGGAFDDFTSCGKLTAMARTTVNTSANFEFAVPVGALHQRRNIARRLINLVKANGEWQAHVSKHHKGPVCFVFSFEC